MFTNFLTTIGLRVKFRKLKSRIVFSHQGVNLADNF